jgi:hypothetical protein
VGGTDGADSDEILRRGMLDLAKGVGIPELYVQKGANIENGHAKQLSRSSSMQQLHGEGTNATRSRGAVTRTSVGRLGHESVAGSKSRAGGASRGDVPTPQHRLPQFCGPKEGCGRRKRSLSLALAPRRNRQVWMEHPLFAPEASKCCLLAATPPHR